MTARQKIEQLTRSWYGYSVFAAVLSVLSLRASGVLSLAIGLALSIVLNAIGLVVSLAVVTFLGRSLVNRSRGTRLFLVVFSGLFCVLGVLGTLGAGWDMLHSWSLASLCSLVMMASCTMLNGRSFRVLGETGVRAYFV
jgi:hypothetical protein